MGPYLKRVVLLLTLTGCGVSTAPSHVIGAAASSGTGSTANASTAGTSSTSSTTAGSTSTAGSTGTHLTAGNAGSTGAHLTTGTTTGAHLTTGTTTTGTTTTGATTGTTGTGSTGTQSTGTTGTTGTTSATAVCQVCSTDTDCGTGGACAFESQTAATGYCAPACTAAGSCADPSATCADVFQDGSQYCYPANGCAAQGSTGSTGSTGQTCQQCATAAQGPGGACYAQAQTCGANSDSVTLAICLNSCSDQTCANACASASPNGVTDYQAFADCILNGACATECGGTSTSGSTGSSSSGTTGTTGTTGSSQCVDTYANYASNFFSTNCTRCHTHNHTNLNSYAKVTGSLESSIKSRISSGNMPIDVSLTQADINRILAWYNPPCNAPQ